MKISLTMRTWLAIGLCLGLNICAAAEEWPNWRGPRGNGSWQAPALPESWPEAGLPVVWKQPLAPGFSGISVAQGRVYTMDRPTDPADSERVVCFEADTGKLLWQFGYPAAYGDLDYGKGPRCTPTVFENRVYTLGSVGHLHCLDAATGKELWKQDLVADFRARQPRWGFAASPVIYENLVIIHAGLRPGGCYAAFDRKTGEEVWRGGDDEAGYGTPVLTRHAGGDLLVGWSPNFVQGLSPQTGQRLWEIPYKVTYGVSIATPIVREETVLVCGYWEGTKAIKLGDSLKQAELLWEDNDQLRGLMAQPLYRGGYVYLLDKTLGLVCFKLASGEVVWTDKNQLTPRGRNPQATFVWLDGGEEHFEKAPEANRQRAIVLNSAGELILVKLSPEGFSEQSRTKIIGNTWAHPAYSGDFVFARDDESIVCRRLREN